MDEKTLHGLVKKHGELTPDVVPVKWQIRTQVPPLITEDAPLDYSEVKECVWDEAKGRALQLAYRASYQVNGEHRKVYWSVERWSKKRHVWVSIEQGITTVKKGAPPI